MKEKQSRKEFCTFSPYRKFMWILVSRKVLIPRRHFVFALHNEHLRFLHHLRLPWASGLTSSLLARKDRSPVWHCEWLYGCEWLALFIAISEADECFKKALYKSTCQKLLYIIFELFLFVLLRCSFRRLSTKFETRHLSQIFCSNLILNRDLLLSMLFEQS